MENVNLLKLEFFGKQRFLKRTPTEEMFTMFWNLNNNYFQNTRLLLQRKNSLLTKEEGPGITFLLSSSSMVGPDNTAFPKTSVTADVSWSRSQKNSVYLGFS